MGRTVRLYPLRTGSTVARPAPQRARSLTAGSSGPHGKAAHPSPAPRDPSTRPDDALPLRSDDPLNPVIKQDFGSAGATHDAAAVGSFGAFAGAGDASGSDPAAASRARCWRV